MATEGVIAMRTTLGALWIFLASLLTVVALGEQPKQSTIKLEHPGDTALSEAKPGVYVYKSFPRLTRLYVNDKDPPGKSVCDPGCSSAWPPLRVSTSETSRVGDWTVIVREDGSKQWAYKDKPVYTRYHDMDPDAETAQEGFHLLLP
jgi:predicted lipoprotein with Yx(FWY)xxD motif